MSGLQSARQKLGSWEHLWRNWDREAYQQSILDFEQAQRHQAELEREAHQAALRPLQQRWETMLGQLQSGGLSCPICKSCHADIRAYNRWPERRSIFICQKCGLSFDSEGPPSWSK